MNVARQARVTALDPAGRPVDDFSLRFPAAPAKKHRDGLVRVHGTLIDAPALGYHAGGKTAVPVYDYGHG